MSEESQVTPIHGSAVTVSTGARGGAPKVSVRVVEGADEEELSRLANLAAKQYRELRSEFSS